MGFTGFLALGLITSMENTGSEDMLLGDETATTTYSCHINIPGILMWLSLHSAKNLRMPICQSTFTTA